MDHVEGSPWFWKCFGAAIIGMVTILMTVLLNNLSANINQVAVEGARTKDEMMGLKANIAALDEFRAVTKEKLSSIEGKDKEQDQQIIEVRLKTEAK